MWTLVLVALVSLDPPVYQDVATNNRFSSQKECESILPLAQAKIDQDARKMGLPFNPNRVICKQVA